LSLHPRTLISIIIQVLHDDGALLSASINAASLALIDAGIPLNSSPVSVSCALTEAGLQLDPTLYEEAEAKASFMFGFCSRGTELGLALSSTRGIFNEEQYFMSVGAAKRAAASLLAYMHKTNERHYTHLSTNKKAD
jgi:exosome complex component RRP46